MAGAGTRAPEEVWTVIYPGAAHREVHSRGRRRSWLYAVRLLAPSFSSLSFADLKMPDIDPLFTLSLAVNTHTFIPYLIFQVSGAPIAVLRLHSHPAQPRYTKLLIHESRRTMSSTHFSRSTEVNGSTPYSTCRSRTSSPNRPTRLST